MSLGTLGRLLRVTRSCANVVPIFVSTISFVIWNPLLNVRLLARFYFLDRRWNVVRHNLFWGIMP
jgi:hypothetical protein